MSSVLFGARWNYVNLWLLRSLATITTKFFLLTLLNKGKGEDNRKGRGCEEGEGEGKGSLFVSGETPHLPFP